MEPKTQVEIQLGHMCNNRCVFCVSGQQTAFGRARPLPVQPILDRVSEAYQNGNRKLTILGGEPTLQPGFKQVVAHAVALGFEEIVIFTNGVKTAREGFIDEVIAIGGERLLWRISIQGANKQTHERTTRRPGSFDRIVQSMEHLARKGQRLTVNMCVVQSNFASVGEFPALLREYGAQQLHLDMVRPLDAGERTEQELAEMIPRYSEMVPALESMVRGFPDDFDLNIGNLPYCVAPQLARWIHHDGENTDTIAVDGESTLSRPWNKYFVKRRDKGKPVTCQSCVFDRRCNGIFDKYEQLYGTAELVPVSPERLREVDPQLKLWPIHIEPVSASLKAWQPIAPFERATAVLTTDTSVELTLQAGEHRLLIELRPPGEGAASTDIFSLHVLEVTPDRALTLSGLEAVWQRLSAGRPVRHPLGSDVLLGNMVRNVAARLRRLRQRTPFSSLE